MDILVSNIQSCALRVTNCPNTPVLDYCTETFDKRIPTQTTVRLRTENFNNAIKTVQIPDNYKLLSFDVKSLFTSIPLFNYPYENIRPYDRLIEA